MLEVTAINFYSDIVDIYMYGFSVTFLIFFSGKALSDPCYAMVTLAANNSNRIIIIIIIKLI